jgi:mono/diheme cytochrome c family protein
MPVSSMPLMTDETVRTGHKIFLEQACNKCHGKYGRGGSMEKVEVGVDAWGNQTAAADLSSGMFHGGGRPVDIYRRIYSGINGTPMPAFERTFQDNPDSIWYLVQFIKATGNRRREGLPPLSEKDLPVAEPAAAEAPAAADSPAETAPAEEKSGEEEPAEESAEPAQQAA